MVTRARRHRRDEEPDREDRDRADDVVPEERHRGEGGDEDEVGYHRGSYLQNQNKKHALRVELGDKHRSSLADDGKRKSQ